MHAGTVIMRSFILMFAVVLVSCGGPPPTTCLHVDGRGVDGYATLDDALAVAMDGSTICLATGEHRPPSAPIVHAVTIEGVAGTVVTGSVPGAACQTVMNLGGLTTTADAVPRTIASAQAAIVTSASATVTLRGFTVENCEIGVVAEGAGALLDHVTVAHADIATAVEGTARLELRASTLQPATFITTDSLFPLGVLAGPGTLVVGAGGTTITPVAPSGVAIAANGASLELADTILDGGNFGLVVQNFGSTAHVELGAGFVVRNLMSMDVAMTHLHAENRITGGDVMVTGARFENIDGFGLTFDNTSSAMIDQTTFTGVAITSLLIQAHDVAIGDLTFTLPPNGMAAGLALGSTNPPGMTAQTFGTATVHGAITSTGTGARAHIVALDGTSLMLTGAGTRLMDSQLAIWAQNGASITSTGTLTISGATMGAISAVGMGTVVSVSDATLTLPMDALGVAAATGGRADATRVMTTGGEIAFYADSSTVNATDVHVTGATTGLRVSGMGASGTLAGTACEIASATAVGARADGGAMLAINRCSIHDSVGPGAEAVGGAVLDVTGGTFAANGGAAISYVDASGHVQGTNFHPSRLVMRAMGMRADEVSLVVDDGVARQVSVDGGNFMLNGAPSCGDADCSVVLSSGMGATATVGVVTPNCLSADASDTTRYRGLGQSGGVLTSGASSWGVAPGVSGRLLGDQTVGGLVLSPSAPIGLVTPTIPMVFTAAAISQARH